MSKWETIRDFVKKQHAHGSESDGLARVRAGCQHLQRHLLTPPKSERDHYIKSRMIENGWFSNGYCEEYYPEWLYDKFGKEFDDGEQVPNPLRPKYLETSRTSLTEERGWHRVYRG